jgi:hypothetical protein
MVIAVPPRLETEVIDVEQLHVPEAPTPPTTTTLAHPPATDIGRSKTFE